LEDLTRGVTRQPFLQEAESETSLSQSLKKPSLDIALVRGLRKRPLHKLYNHGNLCCSF
jgi:hypothetical protein